jgi:uncharacterized membrane protein
MIPIPSPLHPALIHFPIVLILLGAMVIVASVFLQRWHLPWIAAGLLVLGATGAIAAAWTGGQAEELVGELNSRADQVLSTHEEWGERTRNASIMAALLAVGAASLIRFPLASKTLTVVAASTAIFASYCVANTGHSGGQLVYKHGAGINMTAGNPAGEAQVQADAGLETKKADRDD